MLPFKRVEHFAAIDGVEFHGPALGFWGNRLTGGPQWWSVLLISFWSGFYSAILSFGFYDIHRNLLRTPREIYKADLQQLLVNSMCRVSFH